MNWQGVLFALALFYFLAYWALRLSWYRRDTKNKRKALATLKAAGIPVYETERCLCGESYPECKCGEKFGTKRCVCGWRNETHDGPCTPYMSHRDNPAMAAITAGYMQPKAPACSVAPSCNSCHDCPDLTALPAIDTTKDSKLYMRGFEDGQAVAQAKMQSDRDALAQHWKGE